MKKITALFLLSALTVILTCGSRRSEADADSYSLALHGGFQTAFGRGLARLAAGGAFTRHAIGTTRNVAAFGGLAAQQLEADYHANSYQLFLEGAYALPVGAL